MSLKEVMPWVTHEDRNCAVLRAQFAIAQWYIDRAEHGSAGNDRGYYLRQARLAYEIIKEVLPGLDMSRPAQEVVRAELAVLRRKLEITAAPDFGPLEG